VVFPSPDQRRYLAVVEALAEQRGRSLDPDVLRRRAIQWADWHNGRSGRTARQFVDHLAGELGLAARTNG
jgi:predicted AAA+ superfamily ATPase